MSPILCKDTWNIYLISPIQCIGNVDEIPCVLATGNVHEIVPYIVSGNVCSMKCAYHE